jgi:hypothetical protein
MKTLLNIWEHLPHLLHGLYELFKHPEDAKYILYGTGVFILLLLLSSISPDRPTTPKSYKPAAPLISVQESAAEKKRFKIAINILSVLLMVAIVFFIVVLVKRLSA